MVTASISKIRASTPTPFATIEHTTLSDIIVRNTDTPHMQSDAFVAFERVSGTRDGITPDNPALPQLVVGANGNDTLTGGPQGDYLFAANGNRTLTGAGGADKFVVGDATNALVTDFQLGLDQLAIQSHADVGDLRFSTQHGNLVVNVGSTHVELVGLTTTEEIPPGALTVNGQQPSAALLTQAVVTDPLDAGASPQVAFVGVPQDQAPLIDLMHGVA